MRILQKPIALGLASERMHASDSAMNQSAQEAAHCLAGIPEKISRAEGMLALRAGRGRCPIARACHLHEAKLQPTGWMECKPLPGDNGKEVKESYYQYNNKDGGDDASSGSTNESNATQNRQGFVHSKHPRSA